MPQTFRTIDVVSTNFTDQRPPWVANGSSASQEFPRILRNPKVPRRPTTSPYLDPDQASPRPSISSRSVLIFSSIYVQVFQAVSFLQVPPSQKKLCISLLPHTCHMPHPSLLLGLITRRSVYFL